MEVRNHPLMVFKGVPNWPPAWIWTSGPANARPKGEIGTLRDIWQSTINPDTCFISIVYDESTYLGLLLFDDPNFCRRVCESLKAKCGQSVQEIGGLDFS